MSISSSLVRGDGRKPVSAVVLIAFGESAIVVTILLAGWGRLIGTAAPVGWWTWP